MTVSRRELEDSPLSGAPLGEMPSVCALFTAPMASSAAWFPLLMIKGMPSLARRTCHHGGPCLEARLARRTLERPKPVRSSDCRH